MEKWAERALPFDGVLIPEDKPCVAQTFERSKNMFCLSDNEQVREMSELRLKIQELEDALDRERRRADLCQQQLDSLLAECGQHACALGLHRHKDCHAATCTDKLSNEHHGPCAEARASNHKVPGGYVTIPELEYQLLLLKDKAMDGLQEGIAIADYNQPDMPIIYTNQAFAKITGYSVEETLGKNCRFLQGEGTEKSAIEELRTAITTGRSCVVQLMNYRKNGDPFINYLSVTPIHDATGKLTHYVGIQSDITQLVNHRRAELAATHAAAQAAAATEAKSQFLARMSHEIRTPLNGMIAVGQLLSDTSLSPAQWDLVNTIRCSGETLLTLITDILDFSRIEANKMVLNYSSFKLQTVIEAAMEIAGLKAAQKRLQVAYHIAPGVPQMLYGDAQRLQQILLNIVNNAVKFTEAGEILLEVWSGKDPVVTHLDNVNLNKEACSPITTGGSEPEWPSCVIHFATKDTGIGISANDLDKLFMSFSQVDASPTRRYGGSGLGLAISKRLCEAMGGQMWVQSPGVGQGSTFHWTVCCKVPRQTEGRRRRSSLLVARPHRPSFELLRESGQASGDCTDDLASLASVMSSEGYAAEREGYLSLMSMAVPSTSGRPDYHAGDHSLPLLRGKRVMLVESCPMVLHVLSLALRSWGCLVNAARNEAEALQRLASNGTLPMNGYVSPPPSPPGNHRLKLEHAIEVDERRYNVSGPFDVIILDLNATTLLSALTICDDQEAQRLVFMGWPGQNEVDADPQFQVEMNMDVLPQARGAGPLVLQPSPAVAEELLKPHSRQLGYVTITRPVRQGRLKLALEEVLMMQLERPGSQWSDRDSDEGCPLSQHEPPMDLPASLGAPSTLRPAQMRRSGSEADCTGPDLSNLRILLAEDNVINMKVAMEVLKRLGCTHVCQAYDGEEALQVVDKRGGADAFDVILTDLHMPIKGGMEVVRALRQNFPDSKVKVVAVTADAFEDTRDSCLAAGFDEWLAKPFRVEDLTRVLGARQGRSH